MTRSLLILCLIWLTSCAQPHARLLQDARDASGCESVSYQGKEGDVYLVDACGKTLRMRCLSEWNEPWCCQEEGKSPRTECAAHEPAPAATDEKVMPGFNTPQ